MRRRAALYATGCALTFGMSSALRPSTRATDLYVSVSLESQIPLHFSNWGIESSVAPLIPDSRTLAAVNNIYTQTLARTYVKPEALQVMLSIAYGSDQKSDATQAHRPELCYAAQGFVVRKIDEVLLQFEDHKVMAARLESRRNERLEFITYWVTLNQKTVLPGMRRKLMQVRLGLAGLISDGMLVRTSTVGLERRESFELQNEFLSDLYLNLSDNVRPRYFGS